MLPAASFMLTSHTVLLPYVGAPCIVPVLTIFIATQLLEPHITERELPSPRLFSETMFVMFIMVLETKICRSACCEAGLFVEMKRNTRLL